MKAMSADLDKRYASADAMIADLEAFRKNPGVSLDFELKDLRPDEEDEPTRPLRTGSVHAALEAEQAHRTASREREHRREYEEEDRSRSGGKRTVLIAAVTVAALLLAALLFKNIFGSFGSQAPTEYIVPNVLGKTLEEAAAMPEGQDIFQIIKTGEEYSNDYPKDEIIRQTPDAGESRKGENLKIEVVISLGVNTGEMIDVTNTELQEARLRLQALGRQLDLNLNIDADVSYQEFSDVTEGFVIRTEPEAGATLKDGDTIKLYVSKGPELETFPVPDFVGQPIDKVREQLKGPWKLTCTDSDIEMVDSEKPAGTILWQSIEGATEATEGDTIKFKVSSGQAPSQSRTITVLLPQDGRESVTVWVTVDGEEQYNQSVSCSQSSISISLTGYGVQHVEVYIDGEADPEQAQDVQFD